MNLASVLGGAAGAGALTLLNESAKKFDKEAPRLDLLGMNAIAKFIKGPKPAFIQKLSTKVEPGAAALAGDLISNSLYYAMAKGQTKTQTLGRGVLLGLAAGIGAVTLAKPLGLDERFANATIKTKAMTVAWYVVGGLVAAGVINLIAKNSDKGNTTASMNGHHASNGRASS